MESNSEESDARRIGDEADVEIEECPDEEEADTDLETDRLLGQQRTDDQGFYDDKVGYTQYLIYHFIVLFFLITCYSNEFYFLNKDT